MDLFLINEISLFIYYLKIGYFDIPDGEFYFLEVNTTPGMTSTSFVPQQIAAMNRKLGDVLGLIIEDKLK